MTIRETIITDSSSVFCNADDFAESVIYNGTRTINAVVIRDVAVNENGKEVPSLEVHVANDSTTGISSSELRPSQDRLTIAVRVGQTPTQRVIHRLISHDEGMLVLECR